MKNFADFRLTVLLVLLATATVSAVRLAAAENVTDTLELVRSTYATDRQAFLAENMQLTESEGAAFWPLYRQYRAEKERLGDSLVKLVLEYGDAYPNLSDDRARQLLKDYSTLEKKLVTERAWYLNKFAKVLPATKALRFAQLENRMDLVLRLQLASVIPVAGGTKTP